MPGPRGSSFTWPHPSPQRMGLSSIFKSKRAASAEAAGQGTDDAVRQARIRARRRLVGAGVLLLAGIIGFPLLFETQPRPIPVDIPIEIPRRDSVEPLAMPAAREPAPTAAAPVAAAPVERTPEAPPAKPENEAASPSPRTAAAEPAPEAAAPLPAKQSAKREPRPATPTTDAAEAARAKSLLEGRAAQASPAKAEPAAGGERYVLQVGAFADAGAANDMRKKVEKLGMKTYTQAVGTAAGKRIRVRVGPFGSREEADKALAKAKAAGLAAVVLTL